MHTDSDGQRFVFLRGGLVVRQEPVLLLLDLEARGFRLNRDGDDIIVSPFSKLTAEDKAQIKLWKRFILALLSYEPPEVH